MSIQITFSVGNFQVFSHIKIQTSFRIIIQINKFNDLIDGKINVSKIELPEGKYFDIPFYGKNTQFRYSELEITYQNIWLLLPINFL
jgi:hypothetical protein